MGQFKYAGWFIYPGKGCMAGLSFNVDMKTYFPLPSGDHLTVFTTTLKDEGGNASFGLPSQQLFGCG